MFLLARLGLKFHSWFAFRATTMLLKDDGQRSVLFDI